MVILCNNMQKRDQGRQFLRKRNYPAHQITKSFLVHRKITLSGATLCKHLLPCKLFKRLGSNWFGFGVGMVWTVLEDACVSPLPQIVTNYTH